MSPPAPLVPHPLRAGERRYIIHAKVGEGGFGAVYRGTLVGEAGFRRAVAIKTLHPPDRLDPSLHDMMLQRLRDEARLLGRLAHRAIVRVNDVMELPRGCFVVMDYIEGADLKHAIARGPVPPRVAAEIALEVAAALEEAHSATDAASGQPLALVHRDIKPSNIRLTRAGEVRLLDFGIAHSAAPDRESTTRQMFLGTPGYVAPERVDGIDTPAADVFSLGVVLIESLTARRVGALPVREAAFAAARGETLAGLGQLALAPGLLALAAEMTDYEYERRPSAADVAARLQDLLADLPGPWLRAWAREAVPADPAPATELPLDDLLGSSSAEATHVGPSPRVHEGDSASLAAAAPDSRAVPTAPPVATAAPRARESRGWRIGVAAAAAAAVSVIAVGARGLGQRGAGEGPAQRPVATVQEAAPEPASILAAPVATAPPLPEIAAPPPAGPSPSAAPAPPRASPATDAPPARGSAARPARAAASGPARASGQVSLSVTDGQIAFAVARDAWGTTHPLPGAVPSGSYRIQVRFAGQDDLIEPALTLDVRAGATTTVRCTAVGRNCR